MTPSQSYKAALEAAADRVWRFSEDGKYSDDRDTKLCNHLAAAIRALPVPDDVGDKENSYQDRVNDWMMACFGPEISSDKIERNHRFLEEALELVQSLGCTRYEAHQLVDYVYGRDQGEVNQEVGGVMVTLAALCLASGLDMVSAGETELARIWTKVEKIRAKQASKPKHSPLPQDAKDMVLVPREPTEEMCLAGHVEMEKALDITIYSPIIPGVYRAMIDAKE